MSDGLSEEVQGLINLAANISVQIKQYYIGVEHILLACDQLDRDTLGAALRNGGITPNSLMRDLLNFMREQPSVVNAKGRVFITPRLGNILESLKGIGEEVTLETLTPQIFREGRSLPCYVIQHMDGDLEAIAAHLETTPLGASVGVQEQLAHARTPMLNTLGRDITKLAAKGKIDPIIGRNREIRQLAMVLTRKSKNNPVLIGEAGVGKTAVAEGLGLYIASGKVPPSLRGRRIVELPLSAIVAGTQYRGQFEERLNRVVDEVQQNPEIILFIDELHTLVGTGSGGNTLDAANILKPALARGDLRCIGATTTEEYHRIIEPDAALERRFSPVMIRELSLEDTEEVLTGRQAGYELHHSVVISPEAITAAIRLAARHVPDRHMPDKALDLLDEACARTSMARYLDDDTGGWLLETESEDSGDLPEVTVKDVVSVLADRTGLPLAYLLQDEGALLANLEAALHTEVAGQKEAIDEIMTLLRFRQEAEAVDDFVPTSFVFAGSVGVGKRTAALVFAEKLFRDEALVSFNLAEFRDKIDEEKLLGAPPGYIGYDRESLLSQRLRREPYAVVLLEQFDEAHPDVQDIFIRGLQQGQITDNQGRIVHLKNSIIIVVVDVDKTAYGQRALGFSSDTQPSSQDIKEKMFAQVNRLLGEPLVEAVQKIIWFSALDEPTLATLAQNGLDQLKAITDSVVFAQEVAGWLAVQAVEIGKGRQSLTQLLRSKVAGPVQTAMMETPPSQGNVLLVDVDDGELVMNIVPGPVPIE